MSTVTWQDQFKEKLQGLRESFEKSGSALSLLSYALAQKAVATDEYLIWAQKNFGLPILSTRFFTETPLSQEMFAKWATHYRWSAECLPVAEWDGSLIVACLEPPQDFPATPNFSLVIAHPQALQTAWDELRRYENAVTPAVSSVSPEGLNLSAKIPSAPAGFSMEELFGQADGEVSDTGEEFSDGAEENSSPDEGENLGLLALEPLGELPSLVRIAPLGEAAKTTTEESDPVLIPPSAVSPAAEEVAEDLEKTRVGGLNGASKVKPLGAPVLASMLPPAPTIAEKPEIKPLDRGEKLAKAIPVVPASPLFPPKSNEENRDIPSNTVSGILPGKPKSNPAPSAAFALERLKKKHGGALAEKVKNALSEMLLHFQKAMILTVDETESQIMAYAWDESFENIPDTSVRIPLKTPSIFNIVTSTQKPFHGYVSLNPLNEKFFEDWNQSKIPDHVTIAPIILNDKVIAMLVGFADKSAYNKVTLQWAEKLSADFVRDLAAS